MLNSVFQGGKPQTNACVGNNGVVNYLTYAEGFSSASKKLLDYVLKNNDKEIDSLIYPICFNMRHSIELRLKGAIEKLSSLAKIKKVTLNQFSLTQSHDIGNIWVYFKESSEGLDIRFKRLNDVIDVYILDIAKVDATGQVFRYPFDIDGNKHLVNEDIINCSVLYCVFKEIECTLGKIDGLISALIDEYSVGTFKEHISRNMIYNLAKTLPKRDSWSQFLDKEKIKKDNNFKSNKCLICVLDIIQENYEMSHFIGIRLPLKSISENLIIDLLKDWLSLDYNFGSKKDNPIIINNLSESRNYLEEILESTNMLQEIYSKYSKQLNVDVVADLYCLFYFLRDKIRYSEEYDFLYDNHKK